MPQNRLGLSVRGVRLLSLTAAVALLMAACGQASPKLTAPDAGPGASSSASPSSSSAESEPVLAPDLQVALFDGTTFDLAEHLSRDGRPVVLRLWSSSCPSCLEDMPCLDEAARRHPEVLFLGIAVGDDPAAAAAAATESEAAYGLGVDLDGSVAANFPAASLPATFLIGSDGTLLGAAYGELGPEGIEDLIARYLAG
jgi:thiol-disulfide isomerase/thioredoxin